MSGVSKWCDGIKDVLLVQIGEMLEEMSADLPTLKTSGERELLFGMIDHMVKLEVSLKKHVDSVEERIAQDNEEE